MQTAKKAIGLLMFALLFVPATVHAGEPPLPPGLGKYVMMLWPPGTPIPGDPKGTVKNLPEPDVTKLGGKVLFKDQNRRIILLPPGQAKGLRKNEAVVYLQRIWMGESFDGWDETYASSTDSPGRHGSIESDTNLQWGPKGYLYDDSGNIRQIGNDQFAYDSANRLISAQVSGATIAAKSETYNYDAFGNLTERQVAGSNPVNIPVDGASNRLLGVTYDAAGNVTSAEDGHRQYEWDSVGSLARAHPWYGNERRIIYDAFDERLGTYLVDDSLSRWTIRDFDGNNVREFEAHHYPGGAWEWWWNQDNFYGEGGTLLAGETQPWQYQSGNVYGGARHYHLDHLGSVRMVTNGSNPGRALSEHDYYPFGTTATRTYQEEYDWADNHIDAMRFGGHWRDFLGMLNVDNTEYIDFMHARHYDPNLGRFLSVDPAASSAQLRLPQSWNRYVYARDNPITYTDPDGRDVYYLDAKGNHNAKLEKFYTNAQHRNSRVRAVFAAFAPGTGRDLTICVGDPGKHTGTGRKRDGLTNSVFREATPEQLRAAHDAAGGGAAGTAAAEALMNKGQQLVTAEVILSSGATEHTKLHEIGHIEQGLNDPQTVIQNADAADNAKTEEEYRNSPTEQYADEFAREAKKNDESKPPEL